MLAYAANRPVAAARHSSPNAMLLVIAVHVAVIAAVMSVKMDLPQRIRELPIRIQLIPQPTPPKPNPIDQRVQPTPRGPTIDPPQPRVPTPPTGEQTLDSKPVATDFGALIGAAANPGPTVVPTPAPVRVEARLLTPERELKPPYPLSKLLNEEEAVLRLRLTIDERGHVVAVDPVEPADAVFVNAARRHLIMHWRYRPATEDGRAILSRLVISLRFQLDG